jgi:carbonic anhydrase
MPDDSFLEGLRHFKEDYFPLYKEEYQKLVKDGQHPTTLFIGCSDSRIVPNLLMNKGPGEIFVVRNVGNFVPPYSAEYGYYGTCAAIEFAVLNLKVQDTIVCGAQSLWCRTRAVPASQSGSGASEQVARAGAGSHIAGGIE